jgi:hypothetical protein
VDSNTSPTLKELEELRAEVFRLLTEVCIKREAHPESKEVNTLKSALNHLEENIRVCQMDAARDHDPP